MRKLNRKILRTSLKVTAWLTLCAMLSPLLLYLPFVQGIIKDIAVKKVSESTGLEVTLDRILLKFPLCVSIDNLILKETPADTMLAAGNLSVDVKPLELLKGKIAVDNAKLTSGKYKLLSDDNTIDLSVDVDRCELGVTGIDLSENSVTASTATLSGGRVTLNIISGNSADTTSTANSAPWLIKAKRIRLENVAYGMTLTPLIDRLDAHVRSAELTDGIVDTGRRIVDVRSLSIDGADCKYLFPTSIPADTLPVDSASAGPSQLWTIKGGRLSLTDSHVVYAVSGHTPAEGFDMDYIEASAINIAVDNFFNRGSAIIVPIKRISATERCGLCVTDLTGTFAMDSTGIKMDNLSIATTNSRIGGNLAADHHIFDDIDNSAISADIDAGIGIADIIPVYPSLRQYLRSISGKTLIAKIEAQGLMREIMLRRLSISLPGFVNVKANGSISNIADADRLGCDIDLSGRMGNLNFLKPMLIADVSTRKEINFPPLSIDGKVIARNGSYCGDASLAMPSGDVVLEASWNGKSSDYDMSFDASTLPVAAIVPSTKVDLISGHGFVRGHGFDIFDKSTTCDAELVIDSLYYNAKRYYGIKLSGMLANGNFDAHFESRNKNWDFNAYSKGFITRDHYVFSLLADINDLNLKTLRLMDTTSNGSFNLKVFGDIDLTKSIYDVTSDVENLRWTLGDHYFYTDMIEVDLASDSTHFAARIGNNDFNLELSSECCVDTMAARLSHVAGIMSDQWTKKYLNTDSLQGALPPLTCDVSLGRKNIISQIINNSGLTYSDCDIQFANDSTMHLQSNVLGLKMGEIQIDTITINAIERNKRFNYDVHLGCRKDWIPGLANADLNGYLSGSLIHAVFTQHNFDKKQGINIGINAELTDSTVRASLFPQELTIGYKQWSINADNHISFDYADKHFDSNIMLRHAESFCSLITRHDDSNEEQEDILMKIANVQIADWLILSPFAPPVKGTLGADFTIKYNGTNIWGNGMINVSDLSYDKRKIGSIEVNSIIDLNPNTGGTMATANLEVNNRQCAVAYGVINDSITTDPLKLVLELNRFPLDVLNPFLPKDMVELRGNLNGEMNVSGTIANPILNGFINCDSTSLSMPVFGSTINLPSDKIPVDSSLIRFDKYAIKGLNENPLYVDGSIDIHDTTNPFLDLSIYGNNMQFVNSKQTRKSELFGRGFLTLRSTAKGHISNIDVKADVTLLAGSNLTYVLQSDVNEIAAQQEQNIVKFVQFNDTAYVLTDSVARTTAGNITLDASLNIQSGTTLNVFISKNGKDRAEIFGNGNLHFAMNRLGDKTMTGRYNIESGFVKYSPPLISQKDFKFQSGSYIMWTGNVTNPTLNISAIETLKANVTESGSDSRIIRFLIELSVTNSLSNMNVQFDLDTNDDATIRNELKSMSAAQRSSQAVNLLLYNTYTGKDTKASGDLTGNPLYSFVTSRLNNWAASAMKGITVTFGFDNYEETHDGVSSKAMRYSYQVSKSLFDDRFKIVIGGNYTPGTSSSEEIAQNLFNDVSLEYMLNKNGNMFLRLFNQKGFVNVLEGEVTQTGVSFVYKRKLTNLKYLFRFLNYQSRGKSMAPTPKASTQAVLPKEETDSTNVSTNEKL